MLERLDATIVAIASPPGVAPAGIVRLSGPSAIEFADRVARLHDGRSLAAVTGSRRVEGECLLDADVLLPASWYIFRAPHSYTREDLVEIHTVGNPIILDMLRQRLVTLGATPADPGEFTARAFLHGALTLAEAESVAAVIRAQSDAQLRAARRLQDGRLSAEASAIRDELAEVLALIEAGIDFVEEPIEFITTADASRRLAALTAQLDGWLVGTATVEALDGLPRILLLGPPNAWKSSLLNRLSGTNRAICAAVAGTTRDILSVPIRLERREAILLDSAGIDAAPDEIIAAAREAALAHAAQVDLVCLVVDISLNDPAAFLRQYCAVVTGPAIIAANKADLLIAPECDASLARLRAGRCTKVVAVSALGGDGLDDLRSVMDESLAEQESIQGSDMVLTQRQRAAVSAAAEALTRAQDLLADAAEVNACADLLAFELREALDSLGGVTGAVTTDDLLGQVFARFCIGK